MDPVPELYEEIIPELINELPPEFTDELQAELFDELGAEFEYEVGTEITPELYGGGAPLDGAVAAGFIGMMVVSWIIAIVFLVLVIIAWWKIFTKAGQEGWKSIIPFYNVYIMLGIVGMPPLLMLIMIGFFIPFLNLIAGLAWFVVSIMMYYKLSLAFGKGIGYTLGLIFLHPIFALMLAFGDAKYTAPVVAVKPSDPTPPTPTPAPAQEQKAPGQVPKQTPPDAQ